MLARSLAAVVTAAALALSAGPGAATSGFGCYRVNAGPSDPLVLRAEPRANSAAIDTLSWNDRPILSLTAPSLRGEGVQPDLFDVWQAEFEVCVPATLPVGARWCPIMLFDDGGMQSGWIKRRFVDHSECP